MLWETGQFSEAGNCCLQALDLLKELVAEIPGVPAYRQTLALVTGNLNDLAWRLATSPDVKLRDPARAVELAQKAVEAAPENAAFWNTLGVAHYRAGDWKEAIEALDKSIELGSSDQDSFDFFFLAMAHWQLGNKGEACQWYDQAVDQMSSQDEELRRLQAEAAELLGAAAQKPWATIPQPGDGAPFDVTLDAEFRWTPGLDAVTHSVYFGTDPTHLNLLAKVTGDDTCEVKLPKLEKRRWYCWRVDAVKSDGSIIKGKLWSFSTGNMVGWWEFNETEGPTATDSSGFGNDGTLVGAPQWQPGQIDGALQFDGHGDYVDCGNSSVFDITGSITVAAWIKVGAFDKVWQAIITKGDNAWRLQRDGSKDGIEFACTGINVEGTRWGKVCGTVDVNDGKWHHVTGVYDANRIYLYVDGVLDNSTYASGLINPSNLPVLIGENGHWRGREWNGLIDDVRIYSYALTEAEVAELYAGKGPGPIEKPEWIVDAGSGDYTPSVPAEAVELLDPGDTSMPNGKEVVPENEE